MDENKKILFVPITVQPPTFGMVMSIMSIADQFDKIIVCIYDNPIIIRTETAIKMLEFIFKEPKFDIIINSFDFSIIAELPPDLPEFNFIGTINDRVYANLIIKGIPCIVLPRTLGYDELFHRNAYKQSCELELLRMKMTLVSVNKQKAASNDAGGEE
jgi:hypothetical protein